MKIPLSPMCISIFLVVVLTAVLFAGMAAYRSNTYGEVRTLHTWCTDLTVQFGRNWYRDGVMTLRGALFWKPASPEFPDLPSRRMHSSYPSGMLFPVHLAAVVTRTEPDLRHVAFANAWCQLTVMLCCALMVFLFALRAGGSLPDACVFACVPLILLSLLPCPFYFFDKCYFPYEAVLPWVALFLLLEMLRERWTSKRAVFWLGLAQGITAFAGAFTEWLFLLVAGCVYLKRLFLGELGKGKFPLVRATLLFWLPIALALGIFAVQVVCLGGSAYLEDRFLVRTGMAAGKFLQVFKISTFWHGHMHNLFGGLGIAALLATVAALVLLGMRALHCRLRRRPADATLRTALWLGLVTVIPCVIHVELLRNQSSHFLHGFEALKFSIPMAMLPLAVVPLALLRAGRVDWPAWTFRRGALPSAAPVLAVLLAIAYVVIEFPTIRTFHAVPLHDEEGLARSIFLDEQTGPRDIVFTSAPDLVQDDTPMRTAYSMKLIYPAKTLAEVYDKVQDIQGDYGVCFLNPTAQLPTEPQYARLLAQSETKAVHEDYTFHRVSKDAFMAAWKDFPHDAHEGTAPAPAPTVKKTSRPTGRRPSPSEMTVD